MTYKLFDYIDASGKNPFKEWTEGLQKRDRAKLNQKLDSLEKHGEGLYPYLLTGSPVAGIQKLRVRGNVELRPMLCHGPIAHDTEFTLLCGATEVGGELEPANAPNKADERKAEVGADPENRRKDHERVS
ncbi:MAG: hypothetical protein AABY68_03200 [Pseudomonadota bacterium]